MNGFIAQGGKLMLVLTRKAGESVIIGNGIRVTVLVTHGQRVRLGIVAPEGVAILREELCREVPDQNTAMSAVGFVEEVAAEPVGTEA
jgi:carbon storage regulator